MEKYNIYVENKRLSISQVVKKDSDFMYYSVFFASNAFTTLFLLVVVERKQVEYLMP